ncbi:MAG TPA: hypothetical protein DCM08_14410 [Microscillaceae bacterium]|nr:hypothetical protein [Microscillaceae bacterium]
MYNNLTIDGSIFNNNFGLSSQPGGQTNAQPISLDAIEQIQVNLAPFDVRQSGFTGAGINAVTRSGDNEFRGSVFYFFRDQSFIGDKVGNTESKLANFTQQQYGFRLGGPIIKNKLFFFVNAEQEVRVDPATNLVANRGTGSANESAALASDLTDLQGFLRGQGYNPGAFEGYNFDTKNYKFLVKLDWNISQNHRFSIRYNYLNSYRDVIMSNSAIGGVGGRQPGAQSIPFQNGNYGIFNNISSLVAELNSRFGSKFSNTLTVGITNFRDYRTTPGRQIPFVDILSGPGGQVRTAFGAEPFSPNNFLDQDVFQITNNFTAFLGKHTLTAGLSLEFFQFRNSFLPQSTSYYRFNSYADFYNSFPVGTPVPTSAVASGLSSGAGRPAAFVLQYSTVPGTPVFVAQVNVAYLGAYIQDEWQINNKFKLTAGLRLDVPIFTNGAPRNQNIESLSFLNGQTVRTDKFTDTQLLWSPRLGFNWDVKGDKTTQIRGGSGIFTGRPPFVWLSNQASNTGVTSGIIDDRTLALNAGRPFSLDPNAYLPVGGAAPATVLVNTTDNNFKFPQVWRTNIAIDQQLPWGIIGTLEAIYTQDLNAVFHRDLNLVNPTGTAVAVGSGSDTRQIFPGTFATSRINPSVTNAIQLTNTNQGYTFSVTGQLQKSFTQGLRGLNASFAYTYSIAKDLTSSPSAIAATAFNGNQVAGNPNNPRLANSNFWTPHRIISTISYRKEYAKNFASTISLLYDWSQGTTFSYVYGGDMNGDGVSNNDLMYIPRNQSEINLVNQTGFTADEQWAVLDAFIRQDKYLSANRGSVAERNGALIPAVGRLDLRFMQEFFINAGGKRNTLQFTVDILNFGNLLNSNLGVARSINQNQPLIFNGYNGSGQPTFRVQPNGLPNTTFREDVDNLRNRWQMQIGIRYIFN